MRGRGESSQLACPNELMNEKTWARLAIQCLYAIKILHDVGYLHRDIKPNNFVLGHPQDARRARMVHVLDFGLARSAEVEEEGEGAR